LVDRAFEASGFTAKTGRLSVLMMFSAVLPMNTPIRPVLATFPSRQHRIGTKRSALFLNDGFGYRRIY
jgi:hypothetical protein